MMRLIVLLGLGGCVAIGCSDDGVYEPVEHEPERVPCLVKGGFCEFDAGTDSP